MTQAWKSDLDDFFSKSEDSEAQKQHKQDQAQADENIIFFETVVLEAFKEIRAALEQHGRTVMVHLGRDSGSIVVNFNDIEELNYAISTSGLRVFPELRSVDTTNGRRIRSEGVFREGEQEYSMADISKDELIAHFLNEYKLGVVNSQQQQST